MAEKYDCRRDILLVVVDERKIESQSMGRSLLDVGGRQDWRLKAKRLHDSLKEGGDLENLESCCMNGD